MPGGHGAAGAVEEHLPAGAAHRGDLLAQRELAAEVAHLAGQRTRHGREVGDPRVGRVQRGDARRVRLDLGDLGAPQAAQAGDAVGGPRSSRRSSGRARRAPGRR
jgi:hypothetical protein